MPTKKNGFTFIEVVAAIFIITLVVVSVFTLIQRALIDRSYAVSQLQAAYLAQEGLELVRNQRDANWLGPAAWEHDLVSGLPAFETIRLPLGNYPKFTSREVEIDPMVGATSTKEVIVTVNWRRGLNNYSFTARTELSNWYGDPDL